MLSRDLCSYAWTKFFFFVQVILRHNFSKVNQFGFAETHYM